MTDSPQPSTLLEDAANGAPSGDGKRPAHEPGLATGGSVPPDSSGPASQDTPESEDHTAQTASGLPPAAGVPLATGIANRLRRPSGAAMLTAVLVLGLVLGAGVGLGVGRATAPDPEPTAAPLTGSGPIGPWQHYGNAAAPENTMEIVAQHEGGVLLLGDSVAARLRSDLSRALRAQGRPMSWDHWNGRPTHGAADMLVAIDAAGHLPRSLVVVSGENDIFEPELFAVQIERIMRTAGPDRHVYWMTPVVSRPSSSEADEANSARLVERLAEASGRHPNLHLVPWADHVLGSDPSTRAALMPDGVHPSPEGTEQLATMILATMADHPA